MTVKTPVSYGNDAVITVELNATINATVKLSIDGKERNVALVNGKGVFNASGLSSGNHDVGVIFVGDNYYARSENSTSFIMDNATLAADVTGLNVTVEQNTSFVINVTDDFKGNVSIKVGDKVLYNGTVKTMVDGAKLLAGNYVATVVFYGDSNYNKLTLNNVKFTVLRVTPAIGVVIGDVTYPANATAVINIGNKANGTVNVTVDGKVFKGTVSNGKVSVNLTGLSAGSKVATVEFFTADKYNNNVTASAKFTINKNTSSISISVESIYKVGDKIEITLNIVNSTGAINVTINGKAYKVDGKKVTIPGGLGAGDYIINAVLAGDKNYTGSAANATFKVVKNNVTISVNDTTVPSRIVAGTPVKFTANLNETVTGDVIFTINGANYTVHVNGKDVATYDYTPVDDSTITVVATFTGDNKYNGNKSASKEFAVNKISTDINVTVVSPIKVGETAVFTVNMNVTINATVQVKVGDKTYDVAVVNGKGSQNVSGLASNTYNVIVTFAGDTKYAYATNDTTLTVNKIADYAINVTATNITFGQNATVTVVLPSDVNSTNLVIKVNNSDIPYEYTMVNGIATAVIPNLQPGEYEVNVTYKGDGKYSAKDKNGTKFRVTGTSVYDIKINVESHPYGEYSIINVTVPRDVENNVTITVDGVPYSVKANTTTGIATLRLNNLSGGLHAVIASYPGDMEYDARSNSTTFTVARASTTIDVKFTTPKFVGDNVIVNVELNQKVNGTVTLHVDNNNYTVYVKNGKGSYNIGDLINKTYSISASFAGDVNFTGSASAVKHLAVNKIPTNLTVTLSEAVIRVDGTSVVNIKLNQKINATVTVKVNGKEYTVSLTNGEGSLTLSDLANATYTINATFAETDKYLGNTSNTVTLKVNKISTSVDVSVDSPIVVGDDAIFKVTMNPGINATVKLIVGSKSYDVAVVNGKGNYTVSNLVKATYNVKAVFAGDDKYTGSSSATKQLVVNQVPTKLSIKLDKTPIIVGDKAVVSVELDKSITTAVTVKVNGKNHVVGLVNGKGSLTLSDLAEGTYTINATYAGDTKYIGSTSNTVTLKVEGKTVTEMSVDIDVEKGIATVVLPDGVTGNVTVVIDGKVYNVTDITEIPVTIGIGDLKPGNHTVEVIYSGDKYFTPASKINDVEVPKVDDYKINVDTKVDGSSVDITVSLPKDVTGPVLIDVDGVGYYANVTGGQATLHLDDLSKGEHNVVVKYPGDDYYAPNGNTTSFEIDAKETSMSIKVDDDEIVIELPEDATGSVEVSIDGKPQTVPLKGGRAVVDISGLEPGQHTVDVTYPGDDNYDPVSNSTSFEVPKVSDYPIDITEKDGKLVITVPEDATGSVTVSIDGKPQTVPVSGGKAVVDISGLEPGKHGVEVTYPGDKKYAQESNATIIDIPKVDDYKITANAKVDGSSVDITVSLPKDVTGPVLIDVDGVGYYANVTGGQATLHLDDLSKGEHNVVVKYPGDDYYAPNGNTTSFEIDAKETSMSIKVDDDEIVIELPEDATGSVEVSIDGKPQTVPLKGGRAVVDISGLEPGQHTVDVTYPGDDNYDPVSNSTSFEVPKVSDYPIDITEKDGKLVITVPEDATGSVTVSIDGKPQTVPVSGGKAVVDISGLEPGKHGVEVTYPGDKKYAPVSNATIVDIPKVVDYPFEVIAEDINVGQKTNITVNLPKDINGQVLVDIGGVGYYVTVTNGVAHIELPLDLKPGSYDAVVTFPGNDKYESKTVKDSFKVVDEKVPVDIKIEGDEIVVELPEDATGNVTVSINGKTQTVPVIDGKAVVNISDLEPGNYTVDVTYSGDDKYPSASNSTSFEVPKIVDYPIDISNTDDKFIVTVPEDATGDVKVTIDGKSYTVPIKDGKAVIDISDLPEGSHNFEVTYPGNDKYASKTVNGTIVKERYLIMTAPAVVKYYSGSERFIVYLTDNKGNKLSGLEVKITINGKTYTRTSENGEASIALNLISRNYTVKVDFDGNDEFKPQSINSTVEILPTIYAKDVLKVFKNGTHYYGLFLDGQGNPLANTEVNFNINGVFYTRTTNASGWAKLNINLPEGKYILTAINPVTGEMRTNNVTVFNLIESGDLVKYYKNGTQFIARIHSDDGGWVKAGVDVTFNINGVFYTRQTNETGHVKLNINLPPGDYIITAFYKNARKSNNVKVLSKLVTSDLNMKYHDGSKFVVKTLDGQGNPAPHQNVSFNINGILYSRMTNDVGEAGLNINLPSGKYIITSKYGEESKSNTITIGE